MNKLKELYDSANEALFIDKLKDPKKVEGIITSEIYYVLKQYFDINLDSFKSSVSLEKDGLLNVDFSFKANRILLKRGVELKE